MKATILVLEDEPLSRLSMERTFKSRTDFTVLSAKDGETAVKLADEHKINLIIADIGLPGIDGIEAARRIRVRQDAMLIFLSGNRVPFARFSAGYALRYRRHRHVRDRC